MLALEGDDVGVVEQDQRFPSRAVALQRGDERRAVVARVVEPVRDALAAAAKGVATLWLEKEQLQELGLTIKQLLGSEPAGEESAPPDAPSERSGANFDFKVARLAVGLHRERGLYLILVHDTPGEREPATLAIWVSPRQLAGFAEQALEVCAAGRPRCHLCGAPIKEDEAHACPHSNGHVRV